MTIKQIHHISDWQEIVADAADSAEIVVFKKSPTCAISLAAERRFDNWASGLAEDCRVILAKVDVKADQWLSQFLAEELRIKHESPQVIWLFKDRTVKWHKSHQAITAEALQAQL
jgi:bacillithiol system protein YtxJ